MFTALCIGFLCVFVFGTGIRFGVLAGFLGRAGVLPGSDGCTAQRVRTQALIPFIWQFYLFIRAPRILDKFRNIILRTLLTLSPTPD